ncbi:MAG: YaaR family protein [Peptococcaceae bacterium]|nr:YaaR family protein [Peptococcaceae bacterium]
MRIEFQRRSKHTRTLMKAEETVGVHAADKKDFLDVLEQQEPLLWQESLNKLLHQLDDLGGRLARSFSLPDLRNYKDLLRHFLKETQGKVYVMRQQVGWSRFGKSKLYQRIERINLELDELTKITLSQQKDPLKMLNKLDEIRGLLVDLYS